MGIFKTIGISASGLSIQRMKLDVIAENLANVETTKTPGGGPYQRKTVTIKTIQEKRPSGIPFRAYLGDRLTAGADEDHISPSRIAAAKIPEGTVEVDKNTPFTLKYDPYHPDADSEGVVRMPNVNVIDEMVDMITATRAYEANVTAIQSAKNMFLKALEI
ncbi:MAG: flagellar basal body rod protein FlgC [Candidatus Krumholzibacteriota bacterium]|nr:flagellar basal body rod protein FlgC [Candidatus Krumholzibacteriota bacterium]